MDQLVAALRWLFHISPGEAIVIVLLWRIGRRIERTWNEHEVLVDDYCERKDIGRQDFDKQALAIGAMRSRFAKRRRTNGAAL